MRDAFPHGRDYALFLTSNRLIRIAKKSLHDPDSLKWSFIRANDDASVMCFEYRAKNGFGAMRLQHATYADKKFTEGANAWNKRCANVKLFDVTPGRS